MNKTMVDPHPDCPDCQGSGLRDSGGEQPWGAAIFLPCDCSNREPTESEQGLIPIPDGYAEQ